MRETARAPKVIFSFIVDKGSRFLYDGFHLTRSLLKHCGGDPTAIHVHITAEAGALPRELFADMGCTMHELTRFGDGRYCNKISELHNLGDVEFDIAVLLDTDTIAIADLRPFLSEELVLGKIVDVARPPIDVLDEIVERACIKRDLLICTTDAGVGNTYAGNCNGGFYSIPKAFCKQLSARWRHWALWLLGNLQPLARVGHENHVDQVSFWLALLDANLPFAPAPSNVNYFTHFVGEHVYFDKSREIALIHHHHCLNVLGFIDVIPGGGRMAAAAVARANLQIGSGFDNRVFWDQRYEFFPDRGSGVGSRGENLEYKRELLKEFDIESATSVLDIGCGDVAVVSALQLNHYVGIDVSSRALEIASRTRPDWEFRLAPKCRIVPAEVVLCFEVLIHQETEEQYRALIKLLAENTRDVLFVSGFERDPGDTNSMLFFFEPLETSLRATGRFKEVERIGAHTSVTIYRCKVSPAGEL